MDCSCPACRIKVPRTQSSDTPPRAPTPQEGLKVTGMSRAQKRPAIGSPDRDDTEDESTSISNELRLLRLDMAEVILSLKSLSEGMEKCNSRIDSFETRIKALENKDQTIESLNETVTHLQDQLNTQAQASMKNEIEIMGINEITNESLQHVVMVTASKIGLNLSKDDIDWVARAGPKKKPDKRSEERDLPRPVIVRLTRKAKRDEIIKAAKIRYALTSSELGIQGPPRSIYINEHLTKSNRTLFRDARARAKANDFRFCWVSNGRIHVRKAEGCPAIPINNSVQLERILPPKPRISTSTQPLF